MNSCEAEIAQMLSAVTGEGTGTDAQWPDFISHCCLNSSPHFNNTLPEVKKMREITHFKGHPVALTLQSLQTACLGQDSVQKMEKAHTYRCSSEVNTGKVYGRMW